MRGLKHVNICIPYLDRVASFTDAWIETELECEEFARRVVASFTDAWIETKSRILSACFRSRIFYRCVD